MIEITHDDVIIKNRWFLRLFLNPRVLVITGFCLFATFAGVFELLIPVGILVLLWLYYYLSTKFFSIEFKPDVIVIHQGIVSRKFTYIPYNKVENVVVERDIFDRMFGTSRVVVDNLGMGHIPTAFGFKINTGAHPGSKNYSRITPGITGERLFLPGLLPESAEKIKEFVLAKQKEFATK